MINRNLAIALIVNNLLMQKEDSEIKSSETLTHIQNKLRSKINPYISGTKKLKDRVATAQKKKKKNFRDLEAIAQMQEMQNTFRTHADLTNNAFKKTHADISVKVTIEEWILAIFRKEKYFTFSYCDISRTKLYEYTTATLLNQGRLLNSMKVANLLIKNMDDEIKQFEEVA